MTYACVAYEGFAFDLLRQTMWFVCCHTQRVEKMPEKVVTLQRNATRRDLAAAE
jgi:hypothetical protein